MVLLSLESYLLFKRIIFCIVTSSLISIGENRNTFDAVQFGAVGDGKTDDSKAFSKAWKAVCEAGGDKPTLAIPYGKTFLLQSTRFEGPCKSQYVQIQRTDFREYYSPESSKARTDSKSKCWLCFNAIYGLIMQGSGTINGLGSSWWQAMYFHDCNNFDLSGFTIRNSPKVHMAINHCNGGSISNIHINSPDDSPNTDGITISESKQVHIHDSVIESGDDCVAINGGSFNINVTGIACGPGHGISIGSLGDNGQEDIVEEVHVQNCSLNGTQNGVRIKTFQNGSGYARKISFEEITLINCKNPIIIDQNYNPVHHRKIKTNSLEVSAVSFTSVYGTSANEQAITLDCSSSPGCFNIVMNKINITSSAPGKQTRAYCKNAYGTSSSTHPAVDCLSKLNDKTHQKNYFI
ncbi:hypothetical protein ACOSP7_008160 [Xanthoceras sorbifolium]